MTTLIVFEDGTIRNYDNHEVWLVEDNGADVDTPLDLVRYEQDGTAKKVKVVADGNVVWRLGD